MLDLYSHCSHTIHILMQPDIQRLGFEAWADNVVVNVLENFQGNSTGDLRIQNENVDVNVTVDDNNIHVVVRAYVCGAGWNTHERNIKR